MKFVLVVENNDDSRHILQRNHILFVLIVPFMCVGIAKPVTSSQEQEDTRITRRRSLFNFNKRYTFLCVDNSKICSIALFKGRFPIIRFGTLFLPFNGFIVPGVIKYQFLHYLKQIRALCLIVCV